MPHTHMLIYIYIYILHVHIKGSLSSKKTFEWYIIFVLPKKVSFKNALYIRVFLGKSKTEQIPSLK